VPVSARSHVSRLVAAVGLLVGGSAGAGPALNLSEGLASRGAPVYRVHGSGRLCARAADPAAYAASEYTADFRTLIEGEDGWLFRSELDLITDFSFSEAAFQELRRLGEALRQRGTELVIVYQPPRGLTDGDKLRPEQQQRYDRERALRNYTALLQDLRERSGVSVAPLERLVSAGKDYEYFFRRDHHWTPAGAEHTARLVAETVRALPAFAGVPRKQYVTRRGPLLAKPGTLQKMAAQICQADYSLQYLPGHVTEQAGGGGLLDDDGVPQIALVGTSNSDASGGYNFAGFLRQHLGADLLEQALTGGSFEGALLRYLPSAEFQNHPPKVLIWEMPYQVFPSDDRKLRKVMREALALVGNGCRSKGAVLARRALPLRAGQNEVLFNGGGRVLPLRGAEYLVDLQFSDAAVKDLDATIWYLDGRKEALKLHFNQYVDNGGRFVAVLRDDREDYANAEFMALTVNLAQPPAQPLTLDAALCSREDAPAPRQQTAHAEPAP